MRSANGRSRSWKSSKSTRGAYTKAFGNRGQHLKKYYIDGFSGAGLHLEKGTL